MDFVKIVYRYRNRFLNSEGLAESLKKISKETLDDGDLNELEIIKKDVNDIIKNTKITLDDEEINRSKSASNILKKLKIIINNPNNSDVPIMDKLQEGYENIKKREIIKRDSGNRYVE